MPRTHSSIWAVSSTLALLVLAVAGITVSSNVRINQRGRAIEDVIENAQRVSASVITGGEPRGESAFAVLRQAGVRTIVSVDGARPDVEAARRHGLRYVHIPIGYDAVPEDAVRMLMRVIQECHKPLFVHCHHGKHRGPAAAAILAILVGELDNAGGLQLLERAGTSTDYTGLWRDVGEFSPLPADGPVPLLVEAAEPEPFVDTMVQIDECFDRLAQLVNAPARDARSRVAAALLSDRPDAQTVELAVNLHEFFREAVRLGTDGSNAGMQPQMIAAEHAARSVAHAARNCPIALPALVDQMREHCQACHRQHRN